MKEVKVDGSTKYVTSNNNMGFFKPGTRREDNKKGDIGYVSRFVPVVSESSTHVAYKDLEYEKDCVPMLGIPIYVGRVIENRSYNPALGNHGPVDEAPTLDVARQVR